MSITFYHLIVKFTIALFLRLLYTYYFRVQRIELGWKSHIKCVAPAGVASALDIGLSNWSLEFITISLLSLIIVILLISGGLLLFSYGSTQFNPIGFSLVLFASFVSGFRWAAAQFVTQKSELGEYFSYGLSNPIDMIYHIQPWMALALLPLALGVEGVEIIASQDLFRCSDYSRLLYNMLYLLIGALLGFCLECAEYLVICHASSLTLSIAGIFK
ncbi:unnamed protein product, partial [Protopolystoma xenopodis]